MKKILTFVLVGMAINYFMDSERGSERRGKVKNWIDDVKDDFDDLITQGKQKAQRAAEDFERTIPTENV